MESLLLITDADLGAADQQLLDTALTVLRKGADVEVCRARDPGELDGVLQRSASRTLVSAGGDHRLHELVAALHKRNEIGVHTLGLLPLGSDNGFARTNGVPIDPEQAAEVILAGRIRSLDLLVDEFGEVVVTNASAIADDASDGVAGGRLGVIHRPVRAALTALHPPSLRVRIEVDGETVTDLHQPVLSVTIANGAPYDDRGRPAENMDPGDGLADVTVHLAAGLRRPRVLGVHGREVSISGEPFRLTTDGRADGLERRRSWHVEAGAYHLLLP